MIDTADDIAKDAKQADSVTMSDGEQFASAFYSDAPAKPADPVEDKAFMDDMIAKRDAQPVAKPVSFKQAFAEARKAGKDKFYYKDPTGKNSGWKSTALAGEAKPASKPVAKPAVSANEARKAANQAPVPYKPASKIETGYIGWRGEKETIDSKPIMDTPKPLDNSLDIAPKAQVKQSQAKPTVASPAKTYAPSGRNVGSPKPSTDMSEEAVNERIKKVGSVQ